MLDLGQINMVCILKKTEGVLLNKIVPFADATVLFLS
jgi:hypothetical protein